LLNGLLPSLALGVPVIARKFDKFDPEEAFRLIQDHAIRNIFLPPTALRMMRTVPNPRGRFDLALRTIASAGEALGTETFAWGQSELGLSINEAYGQTECNLVIASCAAIGISRAGSIGKAVPGHDVAIIRPDGSVAASGELGQIAVKRPDPVMFLGYWNRPDATAEKFIGDWMTTGDQGIMDAEGYIRFIGRDDALAPSKSRIACCVIPPSPLPPPSASRIRCAPRSSKPSSSSDPASPKPTHCATKSVILSVNACPRTNIRAKLPLSTRSP
jgi:acetyl-CoA synthetase